MEQREKLKNCRTREQVESFMKEEKVRLTEDQIKAVVGGMDDPATYLPEIFDDEEE